MTAHSLPSPGLSNPAELLLPECHCLGSADCLNIPPQEDMGESFQVRQSLCMDRPGWMKDLPEACPLPPQPAWTSWEEAIPDYRTWAGRRVSQPPWRIGHMSPALETVFLNVPHKAEVNKYFHVFTFQTLNSAQLKPKFTKTELLNEYGNGVRG